MADDRSRVVDVGCVCCVVCGLCADGGYEGEMMDDQVIEAINRLTDCVTKLTDMQELLFMRIKKIDEELEREKARTSLLEMRQGTMPVQHQEKAGCQEEQPTAWLH